MFKIKCILKFGEFAKYKIETAFLCANSKLFRKESEENNLTSALKDKVLRVDLTKKVKVLYLNHNVEFYVKLRKSQIRGWGTCKLRFQNLL